MVLKPTDRQGGLGVVVVRSPDAFRRLVRDDPASDFSPFLAHAFAERTDIDISVLAKDGRVLHSVTQTPIPAGIRFLDHPPLSDIAAALVREAAVTGFAHFDARWRPDGEIALLECNTRPWASLSKSTWCGLNFVRAIVEAALGRPAREPATLTAGIALNPDAWVLSALRRPSLWRTLGPDRKRLLFGAVMVFITMRWRDRWNRLAGLFEHRRGR